MNDNISCQEQERRKQLSDRVRATVVRVLPVKDSDETSVMLVYHGFYLQISFSEFHPLMVFYLARGLDLQGTHSDRKLINELNLSSVLGSHALNSEVGCYSFRAAHWLDTELSQQRLIEMLDRCADEATRGYDRLMKARTS